MAAALPRSAALLRFFRFFLARIGALLFCLWNSTGFLQEKKKKKDKKDLEDDADESGR